MELASPTTGSLRTIHVFASDSTGHDLLLQQFHNPCCYSTACRHPRNIHHIALALGPNDGTYLYRRFGSWISRSCRSRTRDGSADGNGVSSVSVRPVLQAAESSQLQISLLQPPTSCSLLVIVNLDSNPPFHPTGSLGSRGTHVGTMDIGRGIDTRGHLGCSRTRDPPGSTRTFLGSQSL
jgi:hypothetical protein